MTAEPAQAEQRVIITIDGPAGTGKSTAAHLLAGRLGLEFLDTGAMYRAAALIAIENGIDPDDGAALADAVRLSGMRFDWQTTPPRLMLRDRDASDSIRDMDVSGIVSIVAAQQPVREVLVDMQRSFAGEHPRLVSEGRDQGSVVFPDAHLRFYLDADVTERARRRIAQLAAGGRKVDEAAVLEDIRGRDRLDSTRAEAPLTCPRGAARIDTSNQSIEEVVALLESIARERHPGAGFKA